MFHQTEKESKKERGAYENRLYGEQENPVNV